MINLTDIKDPKIIAFGNHMQIIQSILDFDFLCGKNTPSIIGIVGVRQKVCRYFFGQKEILIPGYQSLDDVPEDVRKLVGLIAVMQSGRRALDCVNSSLQLMPELKAGFVFAEGVTEKDALILRRKCAKSGVAIFGPASVGIMVGGLWKLGAIGGVTASQIRSSGITNSGSVVVISSSGGMINELINMVNQSGAGVAYAAAIGGERYPITTPAMIFDQAINDPSVDTILYFGELGGNDEEAIAELYAGHDKSKRCIAYIAGVIGESFDTPQQFGHAKSMAQVASETASSKRKLLKEVGIEVPDSFRAFEEAVQGLDSNVRAIESNRQIGEPRSHAMFVSSISNEGKDGVVRVLGENITSFIQDRPLPQIALEMFLGKKNVTPELKDLFDIVLKLLVDHGPQVSGAVNTMITARAGKDLPAALAAGILTIGDRFGGAIDQAAHNWFNAVKTNENHFDFVERFAANKQYIPGIGHRKYRTDSPDPRVSLLLDKFDTGGHYTAFARSVAKVTSAKKAQLILNVDGCVAALLLDKLEVSERMTQSEIQTILDSGFCNAMFILSRSIGFIAHYLEQRRIDEGLFRLSSDQIVSED